MQRLVADQDTKFGEDGVFRRDAISIDQAYELDFYSVAICTGCILVLKQSYLHGDPNFYFEFYRVCISMM